MSLLLQTRAIRNETTINTNRYSLVFNGLDEVLARARTSPILSIRERYNALEPAFQKAGWTIGQTLELSLLSVTVPQIVIGIEDIHRFNDSVKALTKFEPVTEMAIVFYDYINGSASAIIQAWHALLGDKKTGAIGFKQDYALSSATFNIYGPQAPAEETPTIFQSYDVINLYPATIDLGEHSFENAAARRITSNFLFDNFYPTKAIGYNPQ